MAVSASLSRRVHRSAGGSCRERIAFRFISKSVVRESRRGRTGLLRLSGAARRILLENRKLVTKREDLSLQGRTGSKTGGHQSENGDEKRAHRGSHHDFTNDRNLFVFRSDGICGSHSEPSSYFFFSTMAVPLSLRAASVTLPPASRLNSMVTPL